MPKIKNILLLSPQPFFQARGTPINVREMLYALSEDGYQVTLLCYPFGEDIKIPNVTIIRSSKPFLINDIKIGPSLSKIILDLFFFFNALKLCFTKKFSLFHGIEEAGLIAGFLGIVFRKPFIVDVDSAMSQQLEESGFIKSKLILKMFELSEGFFFKRAASVITVCQSLSDEVKKLSTTAKISQIEDFALEYKEISKSIASLKEQFKIPNSSKIILYGGNFEPYQGIDLLLQSIKEIASKGIKNIHLVLVGGSEAHITHYRDVAQSNDIKNFVSFTGQIESSLMGHIHDQADVLVSPRLTGSNTPLKIYSYMQSGRPIVATKIYSHTQVLDDTLAYLAEATPEDFSNKLIQATSDDPQFLAEKESKASNAKHLAENRYSRTHFRKLLKEVYANIFANINE